MQIIVKAIEEKNELQAALAIRHDVFVREQKIPEELEYDEWEDESVHFIALEDDIPIGACRLRWKDSQTAKAERVAVLKTKRNTGIGIRLMEALEQYAREHGARHVVLHAQSQVVPFYRKLGYNPQGEPFTEAGIEHLKMIKKL